jgi:hypothetical protein
VLTFNSAATIERTVASVRPHVDEVVVYDTGSRDETLSVLNALAEFDGAPIGCVTSRNWWKGVWWTGHSHPPGTARWGDDRGRSFATSFVEVTFPDG